MSNAEIQYLVTEPDQNVDDVEKIIAAIGAYEDDIHFPIRQTAEITQIGDSGVMLKLIRMSREPRYEHDLLEVAEKMRIGVESHFPEEDRERLARRFVGIATKDTITLDV